MGNKMVEKLASGTVFVSVEKNIIHRNKESVVSLHAFFCFSSFIISFD